MPKKFEHQRLTCDKLSKLSDVSYGEYFKFSDQEANICFQDEDNEYSISRLEYGACSENSNDTENAEYRNSALCYDEFRQILSNMKISEKDQQYIFKAFEVKCEADIKLFMR